MLNVQRKRYAFDDPLVRLFVRLYTGCTPPVHDDIVREVRAFARARMTASEPVAVPARRSSEPALAVADAVRDTGIIEID